MSESDRCLLLFAKPAIPGRVKTRLIGDLTAHEAAALHQAFLADLERRLGPGDFSLQMAWAVRDDEDLPPSHLNGFRQSDGDLGDRLFAGLRRAAAQHRFVAAIGSDHPEIPLLRVEEGFSALEAGFDVVLGPAHDGGYYLVGCRADSLVADIFQGIEWSSARVLSATRQCCKDLGLEVSELEPGTDIDTIDDLRRLASALEAESKLDCPSTRNLLSSWGMISPMEPGGDDHENS